MTAFDPLRRHLSEDMRTLAFQRRVDRDVHGATPSTRAWRAFLYAVAVMGAPGNSRFGRGPTRAA
jgi:hypothetical protein